MSLSRLAIVTLLWNLGVIVWGAYVRASGSGAGCGDHWPLCDGRLVPEAGSAERWIEYTHRLTSGVALLLGVFLWVLAQKRLASGHPLRRVSLLALVFLLLEALLGAGLVLFELVAEDASAARVWVVAFHLINTFFLLASLALAVHHAGEPRPFRAGSAIPRRATAWCVFGLLLATGASGAVAALGTTLHPAPSVAQGFAQDLAPGSPALLRYRWLHLPLALVAAGAALGLLGRLAAEAPGRDGERTRRRARATGWILLLQLLVGLLTLVSLAPIPLQLLHLLVADLVWIGLVLTCASAWTPGP